MKAFLYAIRGLGWAVRHERNMRIHLCFAFYVILAGLVTGLSVPEWAAALLCIALVIALELVNTAVERCCDAVTKDYSVDIKLAKDCAAGAVFAAAVLSAITGCLLFFTNGRPAAAWAFAKTYPVWAGLIVLTLPVWLFVIFSKRRSDP